MEVQSEPEPKGEMRLMVSVGVETRPGFECRGWWNMSRTARPASPEQGTQQPPHCLHPHLAKHYISSWLEIRKRSGVDKDRQPFRQPQPGFPATKPLLPYPVGSALDKARPRPEAAAGEDSMAPQGNEKC